MLLPTAFAKTLHQIERDRPLGSSVRFASGSLLLAALAYWAICIPVVVYETTADARIEIGSAASPLQSPMTGRIVSSNLFIGKIVKAGEPLVQLDAVSEELQAQVEQTRFASIAPEIRSLEAQIVAEDSAGVTEQKATEAAIDEARLRVRDAELERRRLESMKREGLTSDRELQQAIVAFDRAQTAVETARSALTRLEREQQTRNQQRAVRIASIRTEIAKLETGRQNAGATLRRATYDIERRVIRAPIDGVIGETRILRPGSVLMEGASVASIMPDDSQLRVVANFPPKSAYGRLQQGAPAKLRLKGFPWTEFGAVQAKVVNIAAEDREGQTRVELAIIPDAKTRVPLKHGMPGELEVEVEGITPFRLVLRTAGQWMTASQ
jgi:multidrug resistance efflux pump